MNDETQQIIKSVRENDDPQQAINEALTNVRGGKVTVPDEIGEWEYRQTPPARIKHADTRFMRSRAIYVLEDDHPAIAVARVDKKDYHGYEVKVGVYDDAGEPRIFDVFDQDHDLVENATAQLRNLLNQYSSVQKYIDDSSETNQPFEKTRKEVTG